MTSQKVTSCFRPTSLTEYLAAYQRPNEGISEAGLRLLREKDARIAELEAALMGVDRKARIGLGSYLVARSDMHFRSIRNTVAEALR